MPSILRRDPVCQLAYPDTWLVRGVETICTVESTEVDHIGDRLDHSPANLRGVCHECHARRTQQQASGRHPD